VSARSASTRLSEVPHSGHDDPAQHHHGGIAAGKPGEGCKQGRSNAEIAEGLCIFELTVKSHIGRIFVKLDLRDRAAAIVYAYDHGVVTPRYPA
jgi:hypothetical protein